MSVFGAYSSYYDLLYEGKDYPKEAAFVSSVIQRHAPGAKTVLDLGCGTGLHACAFAQMGYQVTGLDRSEAMLAKACERCSKEGAAGQGAVDLHEGDVTDFQLGRRFDAVAALFHVISYLPSNAALEAAFACVREHLKPGGIFVFDQWYGPAVLTDRPAPRIKTFENDSLKIIRIATPELHVNDNLVDVRYDLAVIDKPSGRCEQITETHRMRYLFWPEIDSLLSRHGLIPVEFGEWLSGRKPGQSSWNTFVAAVAPCAA
ncbi:MAG TPA: class I SAM-dependent methyltransferase [Methylocella sp.]|nr:class I SAM-dependent methyltransferase [Methylocella sp.]